VKEKQLKEYIKA